MLRLFCCAINTVPIGNAPLVLVILFDWVKVVTGGTQVAGGL